MIQHRKRLRLSEQDLRDISRLAVGDVSSCLPFDLLNHLIYRGVCNLNYDTMGPVLHLGHFEYCVLCLRMRECNLEPLKTLVITRKLALACSAYRWYDAFLGAFALIRRMI